MIFLPILDGPLEGETVETEPYELVIFERGRSRWVYRLDGQHYRVRNVEEITA